MLDRTKLVQKAVSFLEEIMAELEKRDVQFPNHWHIDHLCYRTESQDNYSEIKSQLDHFAHLLAETDVNGRAIATFALEEPIAFQHHRVRCIEVPAPKPGKHYSSGFEHMEIVCDVALATLPGRYPQLQWETPSPSTKYYNEELKAMAGNKAIKFHHQSLHSVVNLENNRHVFDALIKSNVLDELRRFQPLVVGTFPLNLGLLGSDVDITLSNNNLQDIRELCLKYYSHLSGFQMHTACLLNQDSLIIRFAWNSTPFELFAQTTSSFQQNGYRHMIIEERLLKVGGPSFYDKVRALRNKGLKTEPAFAEALGFGGDPYAALLTLREKTDKELETLINGDNVQGH